MFNTLRAIWLWHNQSSLREASTVAKALDLSAQDLWLLKYFEQTISYGTQDAQKLEAIERLISHGVLEKDERGFRVSPKGKRLLRKSEKDG